VRVVREERKGTGFARDRGWRAATGDLIAYLDADTHMRKGWTEKVLRAFARDPKLVCVTGPYWYFDLPLLIRTTLWCGCSLGLPLHFITGSMVIGGNFAIRRTTLEAMGGMDTSITFYGDDTDIGRRANQFGYVRFSFAFTLNSSGRRYKQLGTLRTQFLYLKNLFASNLQIRWLYIKDSVDVR